MDYRNDAKLFKALSDENRLQILAQLNAEEKCACVLLEKLAISQPTLSHHMRIWLRHGWLSAERKENGCIIPCAAVREKNWQDCLLPIWLVGIDGYT